MSARMVIEIVWNEFKVNKLDAKILPDPSNPKGGEGKMQKKKCPHCGMEVWHKPESCYELEANASKRPCGMEKQEEHLKVRGDQVHRALATGRG
jgi:hypothetical protein